MLKFRTKIIKKSQNPNSYSNLPEPKSQIKSRTKNFTLFRWTDSSFVPEKSENFFDVSGRQVRECDVVETAPAKVKCSF